MGKDRMRTTGSTRLGLKRYTVRLVDHDPSWPAIGAGECDAILRAGGRLVVEAQHVGSTAVPDLPAKPILDIAAAVRALDLVPALIERLTEIGYSYRGDGGHDGGHLFVREPQPDIRTVHVHVVEEGGAQWRDYLLFRDALRGNSTVRKQYAELKRRLAVKFQQDRKSYTAAKDEFIQEVLSRQAGRTPG